MPDVGLVETPWDLEALEPEWEALAAPAGSPTQRHAWAGAFMDAFGPDFELKTVVVSSGAQVDAIAPLAIERAGIGRLGLIGGSQLAEPSDFVFRNRSALDRLATAVADLPRAMLLERVFADSPMVDALQRVYRRRTLFYARDVAAYPWIALDASWSDPEQKFSANRRSDVRRARRRAESDGGVSAQVIAPRPDELAPLLAETLRVESAGWKGRAGTALAEDERRRAFFTAFANRAARAGILRLAFLRIGGETAAVQLAAECGGRYWLLKVGYDERFKRCSPGTLLMVETVRHAAAQGLGSYELLGTVEPWTRMWTDRERRCVALRAYPPSPGGLAAAAVDVGRLARRRVRAD